MYSHVFRYVIIHDCSDIQQTADTSQMSYMWIQQQAKCSSLEVDHDMLAGHTLDLVQMMLSKKKSLAMNATQLTYSAVE